MKTILLTAFVALTLAACASNSGYKQAKGNGYGYSETKISDNRYRVDYKARSNASRKVRDYALLRAAELTLEKGYDWFVVVNRELQVEKTNDNVQTSMRNGRTVTKSCGLLGCTTRSEPTASYGIGVQTGMGSDEAIASVEIRIGKGVRPENGDSYDAQDVMESLGEKS